MRFIILSICLFSSLVGAKTLDKDIKHAITKAARAHGVSRWNLLKIAYVESSLNKHIGTNRNSNGTVDVGVFQINSIHVRTTCKKYNVKKLIGNAMCAAKILRSHKIYKKTDPNWVARYHSVTPRYKMLYSLKLMRANIYLMFNWSTIGLVLYESAESGI